VLLDDLASVLVAAGVGVEGASLFLTAAAVIPTGAGPYLTLSETGGVAPTRVQNSRPPNTQRPTVQVLTRGAPVAMRAMAKAAYFALDGIFNTTINGVFYLSVTARQEPTEMGLDANNRLQCVFNLNIEKAPS
jgi:hypothetical protein